MRYYDEGSPYWGNISEPVINAGNGRLNARSVKIFADGKRRVLVYSSAVIDITAIRGFEVWWSSSKSHNGVVSLGN
jgi:hypothetical protein